MKTYNYDINAVKYSKSNIKPDKLYSILPTMLRLLNPDYTDTVLDVGCGDGFFTREIARYGCRTIGIDISDKQIELAKKLNDRNIDYRLQNMFDKNLPMCDKINAPFVLNCVNTINNLDLLIKNFYNVLNDYGKIVATIDIPMPNSGNESDKKKRGAIKRFNGQPVDECPITIELYNNEKNICNLDVTYYSPKTVEELLYKNGFREIMWWSEPLISYEGIRKLGAQFWEGYIDSCELGYVSARKH